MRRESTVLGFMLLSLVLCSCGGGGSDKVDLDGVWSGTFSTGPIPGLDFDALINGQTAIFYDGGGSVYIPSAFSPDSDLNLAMTGYAQLGTIFSSTGTGTAPFTLTGTASDSSMTGDLAAKDFTAQFHLAPSTHLSSTPSIIAGNWQGFYFDVGNTAVSLSVATDGHFTGNDADGCNLAGTITQINPGKDLFSVDLEVVDLTVGGASTPACPGQMKGMMFETSSQNQFHGKPYYEMVIYNASAAIVADIGTQ